MSKEYNGLLLPVLTGPVPTPEPGRILIFARIDRTVWVKRSDGTEELISVG